jgi:hypothetical protein
MGQTHSIGAPTTTPPPLNVTVTRATPQQLQELQSKFAHKGGGKKTCKNMKKKSRTAKRKAGKHRK